MAMGRFEPGPAMPEDRASDIDPLVAQYKYDAACMQAMNKVRAHVTVILNTRSIC